MASQDIILSKELLFSSGPPVMLELEVSGEVEQRRMNYVAVEGGRVEFTCSFLADPKPTVIWQRDNINIDTILTDHAPSALRETRQRSFVWCLRGIGFDEQATSWRRSILAEQPLVSV